MNNRLVTRAVAGALGVLLLAPTLALSEATVRCESEKYRYHYCRARTENRVRLERQLSSTYCRERVNWGYDRHGVWVDRGCGAEFRVGEHGHDDAKKVVAGAAAAVAIAAIVSARKEREREEQEKDVPAWAVGRFSGYDSSERTDVEVTVLPGGTVTGSAGPHEFTGRLYGKTLEAGRHRFTIERSGSGFLATDEVDSDHRVSFRRTGSGYGY